MERLIRAVHACLPDLQHYVDTHGPGPDVRLAELREAFEAVYVELPLPIQQGGDAVSHAPAQAAIMAAYRQGITPQQSFPPVRKDLG